MPAPLFVFDPEQHTRPWESVERRFEHDALIVEANSYLLEEGVSAKRRLEVAQALLENGGEAAQTLAFNVSAICLNEDPTCQAALRIAIRALVKRGLGWSAYQLLGQHCDLWDLSRPKRCLEALSFLKGALHLRGSIKAPEGLKLLSELESQGWISPAGFSTVEMVDESAVDFLGTCPRVEFASGREREASFAHARLAMGPPLSAVVLGSAGGIPFRFHPVPELGSSLNQALRTFQFLLMVGQDVPV